MAKHDSPTPPKKRQATASIELTNAEMSLLIMCKFWLKTEGGLRPSESSSTKPELSEFVARWLIRNNALIWIEKAGAYRVDLSILNITANNSAEVSP